MSAAPREETQPRVRLHPEGGPYWQVRGGFDAPVRLLATPAEAKVLLAAGDLAALRPVPGLPGIVPPVVALPAFRRAHGVPNATVVVTDPGLEGVVVPAAVGHGIGNGVRALALPWEADAIRANRDAVHAALRGAVEDAPESPGDSGLDALCIEGIPWAVRHGWDEPGAMAACEDDGTVPGADPAVLSAVARARGCSQFGKLGSGAHVLVVETASTGRPKDFGLEPGQAVLIIAAGSRGLGYQVTEDAIERMARAGIQHHVPVTLRALACVPAHAREGRDYLASMAAALNYATVHRACIGARVVAALAGVLGRGNPPGPARLLADAPHQAARIQILRDEGTPRRILVHRKGCVGLVGGPAHPRLLSAGVGHDAWFVTPGPGAHATFHSACHPTTPGAMQAQREAGIIAVAAAFKAVLGV